MPTIPAAERLKIIAAYNEARAAGKSSADAAKLAGGTRPATILRWLEEAADALADDIPRPVVKVRRCLRCGRPFKSSGPGNRLCDRYLCRHEHSHAGLPDSWGATATACVAD